MFLKEGTEEERGISVHGVTECMRIRYGMYCCVSYTSL